ncbi:hypothetical protein F8568_014690 [Actinomadura sp. LD22]|uniref:ChsH2 C-terminal OB-fold domain-containing protein n=1 Tax=Actinomadura physcomitrii TaxID=2650748 RepID=A0A6I4M9K1_9ACTN|nr:OB-fold domain-containing protein [Actinomadura physcomitrii]MWA01600.1 hypothetical protein [Actinomadura physcomitrii]
MTSIVDLDAEPPRLRGGTCRVCGLVFFPFQTYGCEQCGAYGDALQPSPLKGHGTVRATTVVHRHADPRRPAPFSVVQVDLDEGPMVRGVVAEGVELEVGASAQLVKVADAGDDELLAVRFTAPPKES